MNTIISLGGRPLRILAGSLCVGLLLEAAARLEARVSCLMKRPKPGVFELYVVGESTPAGVPYGGELSFPALARRALGGRLAGLPIEPVVLARGGESVYPQAYALERALCCRRSNPGAVVVYTGNNDAENARGAARFEKARDAVFARSTLLRTLNYGAERRMLIPWVRTEETYAYNMRRIVELSREAGLRTILFTVPSNLTGVDPGVFPRPGVPSREELSALLSRARAHERAGRRGEAVRLYRAAAREWPGLKPHATYLIARSLSREGRPDLARPLYEEARESAPPDSFGRALRAQNELVRALAARYGTSLVDAATVFERRSPEGLPGDGLFGDAHHPNTEGVALLAAALARELAGLHGLAADEAARRAAGLARGADRDTRVLGLVYSGRWLFTVACRHLAPEHRLERAEARFREALALSSDEFSARLGLALVDAARRHPDLLIEPVETDWLAAHGLLYGGRYELSEESFAAVAARLRSLGVPDALVGSAERAYRREAEEARRRPRPVASL